MSTANNHQSGGAVTPADHRNRSTRRAKARGQTLADKRRQSSREAAMYQRLVESLGSKA